MSERFAYALFKEFLMSCLMFKSVVMSFSFIWVLSFLLGEPGQRFAVFFTLSKNQVSVVIPPPPKSVFYFHSDLYFFLPSADFRFCLFYN